MKFGSSSGGLLTTLVGPSSRNCNFTAKTVTALLGSVPLFDRKYNEISN